MNLRDHAPGTALLILALVLGLAMTPRSAAVDTPASPGPMGLVQASVARVLEIIQSSPPGSDERRAGILRVSHELFDFREIARRALGQHWNGLSAAEQDEFVLLFTDVLDRAFIQSVEGYTNEKVTFTGEAIDGGWAQVHSRIVPHKGAPVSVDYRLHEVNLRWAVYDVVSERMSLVASYRSQFNSVLRASTFAELLQRMRADGLRRRDRSTRMPDVPEAWEAGLFQHPDEARSDTDAADSPVSASPVSQGSAPKTEVSP